jgi:hypothetical protein
LDSLGGAFAYYDLVSTTIPNDFKIVYSGQDYPDQSLCMNDDGTKPSFQCATYVQPKMTKNPFVYEFGYQARDDSWVNYIKPLYNADVGMTIHWNGATSGKGLNAFGQMLANSDMFPVCMARTAFKNLCRRPPTDTEAPLISALASDFQASNYSFRRLFEQVAVTPPCLGD